MKSTGRKNTGNKVFVILVALVFLGSMGGAMLYSAGTSKNEAGLPASKTVQEISDIQKQRILFGAESKPLDRYVLITLSIPKVCDMDCNRAKRTLTQMVSAFEPAIYLSEVQSQSDSLEVSVLMESFRGKKELDAFNQTAVEDFICGNTVYRLHECVIRKNFSAMNGNETEESKNESAENSGASGSNSTSG